MENGLGFGRGLEIRVACGAKEKAAASKNTTPRQFFPHLLPVRNTVAVQPRHEQVLVVRRRPCQHLQPRQHLVQLRGRHGSEHGSLEGNTVLRVINAALRRDSLGRVDIVARHHPHLVFLLALPEGTTCRILRIFSRLLLSSGFGFAEKHRMIRGATHSTSHSGPDRLDSSLHQRLLSAPPCFWKQGYLKNRLFFAVLIESERVIAPFHRSPVFGGPICVKMGRGVNLTVEIPL